MMARTVKRPETRRLEIITAATTLFLKQDYERTSMNDIMDKLKIAKGTIYHYFRSKEALLDAVIEQLVTIYLTDVQAALDAVQGNALEKLRALITAANISESQVELLKDLHRPGNMAMHTRLLAVLVFKVAPLFAQVIEQGNKEKIFDAPYPLETIEFLTAGIQFMTDIGCFPWRQEDLARRQSAIGAILERQLGAPPGAFSFMNKGETK